MDNVGMSRCIGQMYELGMYRLVSGKEIQPFRLTLELYRAARLGFRKKKHRLTNTYFQSET